MKTLDVLRKFERDTKSKFNTEVYVVGGYVRDLLRRKKSKDLDVVIRNVSLTDTQKYLKRYGKTKRLTIHNFHGKESITFVVFTGKKDKVEAQIAVVKGFGKFKNKLDAPLKHDSKQRDFTINSMYLPINKLSPKNVIDYHGGKNDISARQILSVGSAKDKFTKSPIRILRAFSMSARTGYSISNHVKHAIEECAYMLKTVPVEPIRLELEDILLSAKPSVQFKAMHKLGVLKVILPELNACVGCYQDKRFHKYDVFNHLIYTCDNIEADIVLRLAAILHDIGKPIVRKIIKKKITFYKHEVIGEKETLVILKRLRFDNATIEQVTHLVRMHMYHYTREWTDAGVRRFITTAGIVENDLKNLGNFPLFKLRRAERLGNGFKTQAVTQRQLDFEGQLIKIFKESSGFSIKDLTVNGNEIMKVLKLPQGKKIGEILAYLLKLIIENPRLNDKEKLLHQALDYVLKENK